jgi:microcystin-dependent protein
MADPYIGEIRVFAFNYTPLASYGTDWIWCNGQQLQVMQFQALFSVIGATYGGDGRTTFNVPDLQGRVSAGYNSGDAAFSFGAHGGADAVALTPAQVPPHDHTVTQLQALGTTNTPSNNQYLAYPNVSSSQSWWAYHTSDAANLTSLSPTMISAVGGGGAHENRQPYLTMNFCIATMGVYPVHS